MNFNDLAVKSSQLFVMNIMTGRVSIAITAQRIELIHRLQLCYMLTAEWPEFCLDVYSLMLTRMKKTR